MIVRITSHPRLGGIVLVHTPPDLAHDVMGPFQPARWSKQAGAYLLGVEHLDTFTRHLARHDVRLVDERGSNDPGVEKFTGPLPECTECGQPATRQQALALNRCPRCGAVWRPITHTEAGPVGFAVECPGCGRRQRAGHAYCGGCGAPVPAAPTGPRPVSVPRPQLAEPALFGDEAPGVVDALEPDHMQRAAGER